MKNKTREKGLFKKYFGKVNKVSFFICMFISIILLITAFFVPPTAQIDPSVLAAVGEIFAWGALVVVIEGIEKGRTVTMSKGDTTLSVNNDNNENEITE